MGLTEQDRMWLNDKFDVLTQRIASNESAIKDLDSKIQETLLTVVGVGKDLERLEKEASASSTRLVALEAQVKKNTDDKNRWIGFVGSISIIWPLIVFWAKDLVKWNG